ncbi:MAG: beta-N-acetylhexosaminidase [Candidatus Riflebacteria bacterium]|nr:beta-N-acetylhexosaminidase [Candidatus Riflebacteria bacterium]
MRVARSLEEKVGQLFHFGYVGAEPTEEIRGLLAERHVGGVILFGRNFRDAEHLTALTAQLQSMALGPLFFSADQEGGSVLRVRRGGTLFPSNRAAGRLGPTAARELGRMCGLEMRATGLNIDFAPVLDINDPDNPGIGIRSFGETVEEVSSCGRAWVEGLQSAGVVATAKHYPGKGAARKDAHLALPVIAKSRAELEDWELRPFREVFDAGCLAAMTSHCVYPALDERPATLSRQVLTGLLREEMGFRGLLVTDDLAMGAIAQDRDAPTAALEAFAAGADQILICRNLERQEGALDRILEALRTGTVPMSRLDESLERIECVKDWVARQVPAPEPIALLHARHAPIVQDLCDRAVEVLRDRERLLPLRWRGPRLLVVFPAMDILTPVEERTDGDQRFVAAFLERLGGARLLRYDPREPALDSADAQGLLDAVDQVLVFSVNAHLHAGQTRMLQTLASRFGESMVLVALRNAYDERLVPQVGTVVATYGFLDNALEAGARTLLGPHLLPTLTRDRRDTP